MNENSFNPTSIQYSYNYFCKKVIKSEIYNHGLRSNLDLISSGWIDSNLTKKSIPILYLSWWVDSYRCKVCDQDLEFFSNSQKWCSYCFVIYTECRHCFTTRCKCKRVSFITIDMTNITNIKECFEYFLGLDAHNHKQIAEYVINVDKQDDQLEIYCFINKIDYIPLKPLIDLISYFQTTNLKNHEISSSDIPILFVPFNNNEVLCQYCGKEYSATFLFKQKYCEHCLFYYIKYTANDNMDVYINTKYTGCLKHEPRNLNSCTQNIQEWCNDCSEISHFKQIVTNHRIDFNYYGKQKLIKSGRDCKLCGKVIYQKISSNNDIEFRLCSDCYKISSEWIVSTSIKKLIPILYLPWWDAFGNCVVCDQILKFKSDSQKWCPSCIIIYTGCRYCLTTNVIFGITDRSQCKKCKRTLFIDDINISKRCITNEILHHMRFRDHQITNYINISNNLNPLKMYDFINERNINWIPYSQITNLEKIAEGGFGIIYKANWVDINVAVKKILNSQNISKYFLNELNSLFQCYDDSNWINWIIKCYGITQDPATEEYMLIMHYADSGNLHNYLQTNFINITWNKKLDILWNISLGLNCIHEKNFIHRDFHSGNILLSEEKTNYIDYQSWFVGDLGLSQPANNALNNDIYGVIPYIAPEVFKDVAFSKEADIYSMGMIMWELTTGCKPFANVEHDVNLIYEIIDGKRPEITEDTPKCFANLMKRCWDSDPLKRPSIFEIKETVNNWVLYINNENFYNQQNNNDIIEQFKKAEIKRLELIQSEKLGPEFNEKSHPGAIYTSRPLSILISNSSSTISLQDIKFETLTEESENNEEYISKELDLDIDVDIQRGLNALISSKKRKIEECQIKTQGYDSNKQIRTNTNLDLV